MNTVRSQLIDPDALVDARRYAEHGYPHDLWAVLRAESPVHWCETKTVRPFWAITRHADIKNIGSHPEQYRSAPRLNLVRTELEAQIGDPALLRMLVNMDPPDHRDHRAIIAPFFRPSALRSLEARVREITRVLIDRVPADEPFDFVTDLAAWHPLKVICEVLGYHSDDEDLVLRIANGVFGLDDPEFATTLFDLAPAMVEFFNRVLTDRQANPVGDLASAIANATIDGGPIGHFEAVSHFMILTAAGHDTTRNALAGGMLALLEHPDQLDRLRSEPELCARAADEIVRWTSPVIQFCRTPVDDVELGGQVIRAGENLALFYPSGNRDEDVFDDPFTFRVDRDPNPHLGFGFGEHFCIGANLARLEIRVLLEELMPRVGTIELAGPAERTAAMFVGGVKHLPIRWRLRRR